MLFSVVIKLFNCSYDIHIPILLTTKKIDPSSYKNSCKYQEIHIIIIINIKLLHKTHTNIITKKTKTKKNDNFLSLMYKIKNMYMLISVKLV